MTNSSVQNHTQTPWERFEGIGQKIVAFDVFDKPLTCQKVWDRKLSGIEFAKSVRHFGSPSEDFFLLEVLAVFCGEPITRRAPVFQRANGGLLVAAIVGVIIFAPYPR